MKWDSDQPTLSRSMPDIAISTEDVLTVDKATGSDEHMDVVNNLAAYCDIKLDNCDNKLNNCDNKLING